MVAALKEGGYDGFFDVELMGEDTEQRSYAELLERSKHVLDEIVQP